MILTTRVKANQKTTKVTKITPFDWQISVREPPENNRANLAIQKIISQTLKLPTSRIILKRGHTNKTKIWHLEL